METENSCFENFPGQNGEWKNFHGLERGKLLNIEIQMPS